MNYYWVNLLLEQTLKVGNEFNETICISNKGLEIGDNIVILENRKNEKGKLIQSEGGQNQMYLKAYTIDHPSKPNKFLTDSIIGIKGKVGKERIRLRSTEGIFSKDNIYKILNATNTSI